MGEHNNIITQCLIHLIKIKFSLSKFAFKILPGSMILVYSFELHITIYCPYYLKKIDRVPSRWLFSRTLHKGLMSAIVWYGHLNTCSKEDLRKLLFLQMIPLRGRHEPWKKESLPLPVIGSLSPLALDPPLVSTVPMGSWEVASCPLTRHWGSMQQGEPTDCTRLHEGGIWA